MTSLEIERFFMSKILYIIGVIRDKGRMGAPGVSRTHFLKKKKFLAFPNNIISRDTLFELTLREPVFSFNPKTPF